MEIPLLYKADPNGRVVLGVGLKSLDCWDRGFESRRGPGCSSLGFVVCCAGNGLCDGLITRSEEPYCIYIYIYMLLCFDEINQLLLF